MSTAPSPERNPETAVATHDAQRRTLRRQGIARRMALGAGQWTKLSATICDQLRDHFPELAARRVGFCWPVRNEPDLLPLLRAWHDRGEPGFVALLPVVVGEQAPLAFRQWTPDCSLAPDRYGIPTPVAGDLLLPEALLIPVNAFDAAGYRIGYGGGFFDRTIAALDRPPLCIGVGFEIARVATIHPQAHDIRLDAMVTEAGVFPTRR